MKSLGDRQVASRLLFLELASVGPLEQVGVRRSGDETDDVEAEDNAVWGRAFWETRQRLSSGKKGKEECLCDWEEYSRPR